jgi:flavin-dependent dehydrogenase
MKEERCNVLVIGAGPAGSCAAGIAALAGVKVLLIDRKKEIGEPVRCAEFIPRQLLSELDCKRDFIVQPVKTMKSFLPDNKMIETPGPGLMINGKSRQGTKNRKMRSVLGQTALEYVRLYAEQRRKQVRKSKQIIVQRAHTRREG